MTQEAPQMPLHQNGTEYQGDDETAATGLPRARKRPYRKWEDWEKELYKRMWEEGAATKLIASKLKRSLDSCEDMRKRLGLEKRHDGPFTNWSEQDKNIFRRMWREGAAIKNICIELNKSDRSVKGMRRVLKLPPRSYGGNDITTRVNNEAMSKVRKRVFQSRTTVAHYVRSLIMRDLGLGG